MNMKIVFLATFLIKFIHSQVCEVCQNLVQEFNVGLQKSEKSNFGGGNTAWEEKRLGNYATSETRLVHIMEALCPSSINNREKCQYLREEVEEKIEEWWFQVYKKDQSSINELFRYLCIDHLKLCCPNNHFGASCEKCQHFNETSGQFCSNHGKCDGNGTRSGDGSCICSDGYSGVSCNECSFNYYLTKTIDTCSKCHESCTGCNGEGPDKCTACSSGWLSKNNEDKMECVDINECENDSATGICAENQYCLNSPGSYKCITCDQACVNCTGSGPDQCATCNAGYQQINNICQDINECSADSELCREPGQKCTNIPGSYSCDCLEDYAKQNDGSCLKTESKKLPPSSSHQKSSKPPSKTNKNTRKQAKKIWTKKFEREFFKLICCIFLLGITSYFFGKYSLIVIATALMCSYYIYYKSIKLDQIFSKSVVV